MERSLTWKITIVTQFCLCVALFVALNIGHSIDNIHRSNTIQTNPNDFYFVSVGGGSRASNHQTLLLKLMGKVIKLYNAQFVVNLSELGQDDPFLQNATHHLQSLKVPWYTTSILKGEGEELGYVVKQIKIPDQNVLDVIFYHADFKQDNSTGSGNHRIHRLTNLLKASTSDWRIVVGSQSLEGCDDGPQKSDLYREFLKYGVDAYLSAQSCNGNVQKEGMTHIHNITEMRRGPYFTSINEKRILHSDVGNGFLLHRVGSIEIVTYLVTLKGEVVHQTSLKQGGRHFI
ncbi:hypothetical protein DCAR_0416023 [Daucus carota subsp. sativus]|uniref:Uncharacterized protein n=1 Tax=Daucus carota subsp. sativus TaxID=79200 RepID=A0AAF0WVR3_DAUCS|nr:PREDICTED: uncharacterized protein LOC108218957 [Daucus carota subsp. sativus]WOG96687.1 hypothetical protein DCAR_0416023 [Daucus carota subsp. sativus]